LCQFGEIMHAKKKKKKGIGKFLVAVSNSDSPRLEPQRRPVRQGIAVC